MVVGVEVVWVGLACGCVGVCVVVWLLWLGVGGIWGCVCGMRKWYGVDMRRPWVWSICGGGVNGMYGHIGWGCLGRVVGDGSEVGYWDVVIVWVDVMGRDSVGSVDGMGGDEVVWGGGRCWVVIGGGRGFGGVGGGATNVVDVVVEAGNYVVLGTWVEVVVEAGTWVEVVVVAGKSLGLGTWVVEVGDEGTMVQNRHSVWKDPVLVG